MNLTKKEQKWLDQFQELILKCPDRFSFFTIGDHLEIYDNEIVSSDEAKNFEGDPVTLLNDKNAYINMIWFPNGGVSGWCG